MELKQYKVRLEGLNPALLNRLSNDLNKEIKEVPKAKLEEWETENYTKKLYGTPDNVVIPHINIHSMLQECSKKYQVSPPKQIGRTWTNYIKGAIIVSEVEPMGFSKITPYGTMVNGNPSASKGSSKVYRVRPMLHDWVLTFTIQDSAGFISKDVVENILRNGGLLVGFGDWRPQWGRFRVAKVTEEVIRL